MSSTTRSTRFSPATCIHCGRPVVGLPRESQQFGIVQAECQACHKRRLVGQLQQQIADKQRKAVGK
jgi:DNA-directed RNA polymerase subunit RPC12/RpoP